MNQARQPRSATSSDGARLASDLADAFVLFHEAIGVRRGLSAGDHKALGVIERCGPLAASELARRTGLTAGAVTGLVNRLVEGGYVRREPCPTDGRRVLISVTGAPRDPVLADAVATLEREASSLLDVLDEHQRAAVTGWITAMTERLHAQSRRLAR
ncbi:MarR family winged helix-turn-helix transcriptional regulator [Myceligenerans salitolerans]|uniref:MarR family transcriptional regulator n=1 Tax=Myceligenerans salitolerans TaxID=1230528 RepID=A0ABS3IAN9_9MICO|nr:MarR family transcriptional regulator [Myceligenerans salitolerans]MBO0609434.1 MarR family transcriptional regulator [Myceligenerans salitolerans]